jgi:chitinase
LKIKSLMALLCLVWPTCAVMARTPPVQKPAKSRPIWICAYYLAEQQDKGPLTPDKIDYTTFSHLIHFGVMPAADGSLDPLKAGITPQQSETVVALAHKAHRKVLVSMGTDEGGKHLHQALTDPVRPTLVRNLVQFVVTRGYDGLDIDMEPIEDPDVSTYEKFIHELRTVLKAANPKLLLTAAVATEPAMFGRLQHEFDQINLMTYDLSGPWKGFKSWYNAALYDSGTELMNQTEPYPSAQGMVQQFVQAGVEQTKLGIGVAFYGYLWSGVNGPRQSIDGVKVNDDVPYHTIMDQYYQTGRYHWDAQAKAPYLSIDALLPGGRQFLSYDDDTLCAKKITYVRQQGLGGVIIWELGEGYRDSQPKGKQDALLQAIKRAWLAPDGGTGNAAMTPALPVGGR